MVLGGSHRPSFRVKLKRKQLCDQTSAGILPSSQAPEGIMNIGQVARTRSSSALEMVPSYSEFEEVGHFGNKQGGRSSFACSWETRSRDKMWHFEPGEVPDRRPRLGMPVQPGPMLNNALAEATTDGLQGAAMKRHKQPEGWHPQSRRQRRCCAGAAIGAARARSGVGGVGRRFGIPSPRL